MSARWRFALAAVPVALGSVVAGLVLVSVTSPSYLNSDPAPVLIAYQSAAAAVHLAAVVGSRATERAWAADALGWWRWTAVAAGILWAAPVVWLAVVEHTVVGLLTGVLELGGAALTLLLVRGSCRLRRDVDDRLDAAGRAVVLSAELVASVVPVRVGDGGLGADLGRGAHMTMKCGVPHIHQP